MIRLSIPARQALAKLTLPVLVVAAFAMLLLGKADALLAERARTALADALAPIYAVLSEPVGRLRGTIAEWDELLTARTDNVRTIREARTDEVLAIDDDGVARIDHAGGVGDVADRCNAERARKHQAQIETPMACGGGGEQMDELQPLAELNDVSPGL